ncbi:MAG: PadR family transcriptional regulator, partial [Actinomycetota bacterium]|nr:PadR family transcriptional regulator [Actinomycetota bacterium]
MGLLARESLSGYDLASRMRERVGFFWQARHSQIYPELARLEGEGVVVHRVVEQQDRPDKKVYEITGAGSDALREWVTAPVKPRATRDEMVLKAYSVWLADPERAIALFRDQQRLHKEQLLRYEEIGAWMEEEW